MGLESAHFSPFRNMGETRPHSRTDIKGVGQMRVGAEGAERL